MTDTVPFREKYGVRFVANAALLTVDWALAWLWFTAHVKPHISTLIFGGVSVATFAGVAVAVFGSFFERGEAMNVVTRLLKSTKFTPALLMALPVIVVAYLTTFTLYLTAADVAGDVRLTVKRGQASTAVVLSPLEKQKAVSYFGLHPVMARIEMLAPSGFDPLELPLRRAIPAQLIVPDGAPRKVLHLVRLVPLDNLFHLRGRREADMQYALRVYLPRRPGPLEHPGLGFHAIYLGASAVDLQAQLKSARAAEGALRARLNALDVPGPEIDVIVAEWLDAPELVPTPELRPGDEVRVVLDSPAGKSETTVKVTAQLNDVFLQAVEP